MHGKQKILVSEARKLRLHKKAMTVKSMYEKIMNEAQSGVSITSIAKDGMTLLNYLDDFAYLWNIRKQAFLMNITPESIQSELTLTLMVLNSSPKSYFAWHHRRWVHENSNIQIDFLAEVEIANRFLCADSRNFHAWRHRRWAISNISQNLQDEIKFTMDMIENDPANFSAWQYRSQLCLPDLKSEIELAKRAFWTDPQDQGPWIYYRWLITRPEIISDTLLLQAELSEMNELIEEEPKAKYPLLASLWIMRSLKFDQEKTEPIIRKLSQLDPIRAAYYAEL